LQDELAQAVKSKNGIPLLITERDAIVSRINAETQEVYSEMQNAIDMLSKSTNLDSFDSLWIHDQNRGFLSDVSCLQRVKEVMMLLESTRSNWMTMVLYSGD